MVCLREGEGWCNMVNHSRSTLNIPASYQPIKGNSVRTSIGVKPVYVCELFSFFRSLFEVSKKLKTGRLFARIFSGISKIVSSLNNDSGLRSIVRSLVAQDTAGDRKT